MFLKSSLAILSVCIFGQTALAMPFCDTAVQKSNNVGVRLEGTWKIDTALTQGLGDTSEPGISAFQFHKQPDQAKRFPSKAGHCVLASGVLTLSRDGVVYGEGMPAIVLNLEGNPTLVFLEGVNPDGSNDYESSIVSIALGNKPANDLLFFGEDHPLSGPSLAFRRAP